MVSLLDQKQSADILCNYIFLDIALEVLTSVVQQEKELKGILMGKEIYNCFYS